MVVGRNLRGTPVALPGLGVTALSHEVIALRREAVGLVKVEQAPQLGERLRICLL
jgi:hypothetical protein